MINPISNYTIRGILWNQGESNISNKETYTERLVKMVDSWLNRLGKYNDWDNAFYSVEIPPHIYSGAENCEAAILREAQHEAIKRIPNSGIVSTSDLVYPYEIDCIHATKKEEIGMRLANMAANRLYGFPGIPCDSPELETAEINGNSALLTFKNASGGIYPRNNLEGFEVCGEDGIFYPAVANVNFPNKTVTLISDKINEIKAIRYCFKNFAIGKVFNTHGLPLVPFRIDK